MRGNYMMMLKHAQSNNYAVPAFSFDNLAMLKAIILAAEEQKAPVIIMVSVSAVEFMGLDYVKAIADVAITKAKVPVVLHLDHCSDLHFIKTKITPIFNAVMLDYASHTLKENIEKSKELVQFAAPLGIFVEAKLNYVGNKKNIGVDNEFINEVILLQNKSNVNALAFTFTSQNNKSVVINIDLIKAIANKMPNIPLVLTDSFDVNDEQLALAISAGIAKINIDKELKLVYQTSLKKLLQKKLVANETLLEQQLLIADMQKLVASKIISCKANNQAK